MNKFTLLLEDMNYDFEIERKITSEFNSEQLDDIIGNFENFLRGCGFHFDGNLEIVEYVKEVEQHSPSYYDYDRNFPVPKQKIERECND